MPGTGSEGEQVDREARVKPFELGWKVKDIGLPCSRPLLLQRQQYIILLSLCGSPQDSGYLRHLVALDVYATPLAPDIHHSVLLCIFYASLV